MQRIQISSAERKRSRLRDSFQTFLSPFFAISERVSSLSCSLSLQTEPCSELYRYPQISTEGEVFNSSTKTKKREQENERETEREGRRHEDLQRKGEDSSTQKPSPHLSLCVCGSMDVPKTKTFREMQLDKKFTPHTRKTKSLTEEPARQIDS